MLTGRLCRTIPLRTSRRSAKRASMQRCLQMAQSLRPGCRAMSLGIVETRLHSLVGDPAQPL